MRYYCFKVLVKMLEGHVTIIWDKNRNISSEIHNDHQYYDFHKVSWGCI